MKSRLFNIQAWNYKIVKVLLETQDTKRVKGRKVQKSNWDQSNTLQWIAFLKQTLPKKVWYSSLQQIEIVAHINNKAKLG